MAGMTRLFLLLCCFRLAVFDESAPCVIELECAECVPEHMPLVPSHRAAAGRVRLAAGDELTLSCGAGRLRAFPLRASLTARCEAGRYRVPLDGSLRHLLELGCQENVFEDVLHTVEHCPAPLQGRAYRVQAGADAGAGARHLATLCFDADRGLPTHARASSAPLNELRLAPHAESRAPLSLLGNFNHMFDSNTRQAAARLFSDDERLNRRLHELFKHDHFSFASQRLTSGKLLSDQYFDDQNMRVTDFVSNKVAVWQSVAGGNLAHLQHDVAKQLRRAAVDVYAGTHGVLAMRTGRGRTPVFLQPERFPVPRYVWTVLLDRASGRALALVVLNDPLVAVSEVREAVFCESACGAVPWLHELRRHRNYEVPAYGLTFCCDVHNFTAVVHEMPSEVVAGVARGKEGMLTDLYS